MVDILFSLNVFIFGFLSLLFIFRCQNKLTLILIYLWHTLFCLVYFYNLDLGADVYKYLYYAKNDLDGFSIYPGTPVIVNFLGFFIFFGFSDLAISLIFNIIGTFGVVFLYIALEKVSPKSFFKYIVFLPSISYWSCAIGKDALAFLAVSLLIYGVSNNFSKKTILISLFLMLLVRPHIALIIFLSILIYFFVRANIKSYIKFITFPFLLGLLYLLFNFVSSYAGLEDNNIEDVSSYIDYRQTLNQEGGSSIDMSSQPIYLKLFTYLFRPLPYEAHNFIAFLASFENLFVLCLILYIFTKKSSSIKYIFVGKEFLLLIYFVLGLLLLGNLVTNLGIASRQKWMIMPVLIYLSFLLSSKYSRVKN